MNLTQVVLITGASSGIGYATALAFAQRGANVAVTARRAERLAELARVIDALPAPHGECLSIPADVSDSASMQAAVEQTAARFGRLDVLIANAGVGQRGALVESAWSDLETLLRTNIDGLLHSVRAAVPALRQSGGGQIVIVSSLAGSTVTPYTAVYGASKAFASSLARSLSLELEADHISVTNLVIGPVDTEFSANRLGSAGYGNQAAKLSKMSADEVAQGIVRATERCSKDVTLRWLDRLLLIASSIAPYAIGRQALKRYKPS
ncbi:MAG: SDR family NAD(P)-dependent oxidoreductase [Chloroflexi bacterium]|nr:SDR family NAD(P)-dependent oxidoreductase [Chloroflexota bacterium]